MTKDFVNEEKDSNVIMRDDGGGSKDKEENDNVETVDVDTDNCFPNFFERHLNIENKQFFIVPNGGTGDCLFKAIAQAMSEEDDEGNHLDIRCQIVDYVVNQIWDKLKDSIEIQHITGNPDLADKWVQDPIKCYKDYMAQAGTLGSFIELTAAAELLQFNFSSIQEYYKDVKTYRVENFEPILNNNDRPTYHFLFTGDYESGHWEHLVPLAAESQIESLLDGTYHGTLYIVIDGVQTSLDDWLSETEQKSRQSAVEQGNADSCSEKSESGEETTKDHETSESGNIDGDYEEASEGEMNQSVESAEETTRHFHHSTVGTIDEDIVATTSEVESTLSDEEMQTNGRSKISPREQSTLVKKSSHSLGMDSKEITTTLPSTESKSKRKTGSKLFGIRSKSNSLETESIDKKKGCFKTLVSYVSSILR
ncbi:unnamed protein product [Allacma fusca]|uniref:OTU domain-containing protein n=1 Tax=Allacma fusca TaxID=39272 RepID=A0A8J2LP76_9HEXA|nr:unnamed protein product [Allacma fusca]